MTKTFSRSKGHLEANSKCHAFISKDGAHIGDLRRLFVLLSIVKKESVPSFAVRIRGSFHISQVAINSHLLGVEDLMKV